MSKYFNKDDGNFYFQDKEGAWLFAPCFEGWCIYEYKCYVADMKSEGAGEEDIARANEFVNSIEKEVA